MSKNKGKVLWFPVVSAGAEHLVMGNLMRRNILTYKAPQGNEGYDLVCIHPDPRHHRKTGTVSLVRVQVKSRYATDCAREFPVHRKTLAAFDYLVVVFLNIGKFYRGNNGTSGSGPVEFYTLSNKFIRKHHDASSSWQKVRLNPLLGRIAALRNEDGFEQIAKDLGIPRPRRSRCR